MPLGIKISLSLIENIDSFSTSPPFVRLSCLQTGKQQSSAVTQGIKGKDDYKFDTTDPLSSLTFEVDDILWEDGVDFNVQVLARDEKTNQIIRYPGVGSVHLNSTVSIGSSMICPLYEDGDENLEIGTLKFSVEVVQDRAKSTPATPTATTVSPPSKATPSMQQPEATNDDFDPDLQFNLDDDGGDDELLVMPAADQELPAEATPPNKNRPANIRIDSPTTSSPVHMLKTPDHHIPQTPSPHARSTVSDPRSPGGESLHIMEIDESPVQKKKPSSSNKTKPVKQSPVPSLPIESEQASVVSSGHGSRQALSSGAKQPPAALSIDEFNWDHIIEDDETKCITMIRSDLQQHANLLQKFLIRFQSILIQSESQSTVNVNALMIKVSIQPLPNKKFQFRPAVSKQQETALDSNGSLMISLGQKTANLAMTEGDFRSKQYKEGVCPRLVIELYYNGDNLVGSGEMYLPMALKLLGKDYFALTLEIRDNRVISHAMVNFEINPSSSSANHRDGNPPALLSVPKSILNPMQVSVRILGIFKEKKAGARLVSIDRCSVDCAMLASGKISTSKYALKVKKSGQVIPMSMEMKTRVSSLDILNVRIYGYGNRNKDIGIARIPLNYFLDGRGQPNKDIVGMNTVFKLWPFEFHDDVPSKDPTEWRLIISIDCEPTTIEEDEYAMGNAGDHHSPTHGMADTIDFNNGGTMEIVGGQSTLAMQSSAPLLKEGWINTASGATQQQQTVSFQSNQQVDKVAPVIKSQDGCLLGCIGGFVRKKSMDSSSISFAELDARKPSEIYSLDVTLFPEMSKTTCNPSKLSFLPNSSGNINEMDGQVYWNQDFGHHIAWALMQRKSSYIKFQLYAEDKGKRSAVASYELDLVSVISNDNVNFFGSLPLLKPGSNKQIAPPQSSGTAGRITASRNFSDAMLDPASTPAMNSNDVYGWILIGLEFTSTLKALARTISTIPQVVTIKETLERKWEEFRKLSSILCLGIPRDMVDMSSLRPSEQALMKESTLGSLSSIKIHTALADLQWNNSETMTSNTVNGSNTTSSKYITSQSNLNTSNNSGILCRFNAFNERKNTMEVIGEVVAGSNKMKWMVEDLLLQIQSKEDLSTMIEIMLYKIEFNGTGTPNSIISPSTLALLSNQSTTQHNASHTTTNMSSMGTLVQHASFLGQCNIILPTTPLQHGIPMNFQLPVRDLTGYRVALLTLSFQATSTTGSSAASSGLSTKQFQTNSSMTSTTAVKVKKYLKVEFLEGNISNHGNTVGNIVPQDMIQHKDVFFESQLTFQNQFKDILTNTHEEEYISRTGYLTSSAIDHWQIASRISIPDAIMDMLEKSNTTDSVASLCVLCKDAGSISCVEIGKARVSLPSGMFKLQRKKFEQWITFHRYTYNQSEAQVFVGRVKIRISLMSEPLTLGDTMDASVGIGMVTCRLVGVNNSRSGNVEDFSEKVVTTKLTSTLIPPEHVIDMLSNDVDMKIFEVDQRNCQPIRLFQGFEMFCQGELGGSLNVLTGSSEVQLNLRTETSTGNYYTAIPVMKLVPKSADESAGLPQLQLPTFDLTLSKRNRPGIQKGGGEKGNADASSNGGASLARMEPKLRMQGCFVPFVDGTLYINPVQMQWTEQAPSSIKKLNSSSSGLFSARFSLGYPSPNFTYSTTSVVSVPGSSSSVASKRGAPVVIESNQSNNITSVSLSTFELLHQEQDALNDAEFDKTKEFRSLLPLQIHVSHDEFEKLLVGSVNDGQHKPQEDDRLFGMCMTAPLYIDSLRRSATGSSSTTGEADDMDGVSWKVATVELYHKKFRKSIATLSLRLAFKITRIPTFVMDPIERLFFGDPNQHSVENARVELGLKQAFLLADSDKSNFVSAAELLNVIKQADQAKSSSNNRRTASNSSALTIQSNTSELAVGLTNASKLLMTLASGIQQPSAAIKKPQVNNQAWMMDSPQDEAEMSDSDLESLVKSIFVKLDIDGDGLISWWEWKSVLTASLCASSSSNSSQQLQTSNSSQDMIRQIISPLDPLLISFFAACSALSVAPSSSTSSSSITTKTIRFPEELNIKEIYANIMKLQQKFGVGFIDFGNNNFQRVLSQQGLLPVLDDEDANPGKGSSKVASRLNQMVKSLRYSNNILSKRLEDALLISQQLQVASENINNDQNATLDSKLKQYEDNLHTIKLQEKVETLDKQSLDLLQQYENAKQRGDKLAIALLEQNASLKLAKQSRFLQMQQRRQQHDLIVQEIETRADELKKKRVEKKRRFYALVKLKMFFLTIVKPRLLEKAKKQAAMKISTHASKARMKKKHQEKRSNLVHAAITIQRYYRGYHTRKELQAKKLSIVKLQSLYRSHQANLKVQDRRVKKQKIDTLLKKNLANVVGKVWRDYQFVRLNKAAVKLSKVFRKKGLENRFDRRKKAMEEEKALKQKEAEARDVITRSMMMHNDKQKAKKLRKHAVHVKVFEDERLKLYAMNHKPTDIQAVSTVCTEANQSNNATVAAASNNGSGSPRDLSTASGKLRYWVGDMAHPGGALVKNTPGIQLSHLGRVELVNTNTRIMEIFYLPEYHMNQGLQDIPPFQKKLLPFDHPGLIWFSKTEPPQEVIVEEKIEDVVVVHEPIVDLEIPPPTESTPPEDPILYSPTDSEAEDDDDSPLVEDFEEPNENDEENAQYIPELSHAYRGYCVNYSLDGEEIESVFGKVVQVDLENNLIALDFRVTNTKDAAEMPAHAKPSAIWHDKDNHPPRVILPSTTDANQKLGVSSQEFLNHCQPGDYIWAHYEHGYLTWFNKQGKLLMSREKSTTRNNSPNKKQPGSGKKNKENKKKDKTPNKSNDKPFGSPSKHKVPFGSKETDPKSAVAKLASGASSGTASPGRPPLGNDAQNKKSVSNAMENKEESGKEPLKTSSGSAKHPFPSIKESTGSESPGKISATFSSEESSFKSSPNMSPGKKMKRQGTAMMALQFSSDEDDDDEEDELVVMRK